MHSADTIAHSLPAAIILKACAHPELSWQSAKLWAAHVHCAFHDESTLTLVTASAACTMPEVNSEFS